MKKYQICSTTFLLLFAVAACSLSPGAGDASFPNSTAVYRTISARLTATEPDTYPLAALAVRSTDLPHPQPSPVPVQTMLPVTDTAVLAVSSTATSVPCLRAAPGRPYVDVTIPDGTRLVAGGAFSKTWRLVNAGSCAWTREYAIIWFSGENFAAVREQSFSGTIRPGQSIDITVDMVAPHHPGLHQSNWKLRDPRGVLFGIGPTGDAPFWVRVEVEELVPPEPLVQPSSTLVATRAMMMKGTLELIGGKSVDFDQGRLSGGIGDDLQFQKAPTFQLIPVNGAKLGDMGGQILIGEPDCQNIDLTAAPIPFEQLKVGDIVCYRTAQGLPGYLRVKIVSAQDARLVFDYQTWSIP